MDYSQYPLELVGSESLREQSQMLGKPFTSVAQLQMDLNQQQPDAVEEDIGALIRAKEIEHSQILSDEVVDGLVGEGFKQFSSHFNIPQNRELLKKIFKYKLLLSELPGLSYFSDYIKNKIKRELVRRGVSDETINYLKMLASKADRVIDDNRVWWQIFSHNFYREPYDPQTRYEIKYENLVRELEYIGLDSKTIYNPSSIYDYYNLIQLARSENLYEADIYLGYNFSKYKNSIY